MRVGRWRRELKLWLDDRQARALMPTLRRMLAVDPNAGEDGTYRVTSLYLDSADLRCYRQTREGLQNRVKFRLRYYGERPEVWRLELKEKRGARVRKHRGTLAAERLGAVPGLAASGSEELPAGFAAGVLDGLAPRVWVGYRRTALVDPRSGLRVTLDEDLRAGAPSGYRMHGDLRALQLSRWSTRRILELKFGRAMPVWLAELLRPYGMGPESISKYELALGRLCLSRTDVSAWTH